MIKVICDNCKKEFLKDPDKIGKNKFCSQACYRNWLKTNYRKIPPMPGSLNPRYLKDVNHTIICEWCGISFEAGGWKVKQGTVKFCSKKCRREWYAKVWCQTDDWKQNRRAGILEQFDAGIMGKTNSAPQIIINGILEKNSIFYENERSYKYCSVDNYLVKYNLIIEVMGTYYHCDIRKYTESIPYSSQVTRIRMDKIKHSYILNNFNIEILYLWEDDINDNLFLCEKLIKKYIKNNGILENYHSINYFIDNDVLYLKDFIISPYMEWEIDKINSIIKIETKEKISKKQLDKWTTYNCENCGKEKDELISHYKDGVHHFCSQKCFIEFKKNNDWYKKNTTPLPNNAFK